MSGQNKTYKENTKQKLKEKKQERELQLSGVIYKQFFESNILKKNHLKNGKQSNKDNRIKTNNDNRLGNA